MTVVVFFNQLSGSARTKTGQNTFFQPFSTFFVESCRVFRPLLASFGRSKLGVYFFGHLALSFGSSTNRSKYYYIDTPKLELNLELESKTQISRGQ